MLYTCRYQSPLGRITLAGDERNLSGLWIAGQKYFASTMKEPSGECPDLPVLAQAREWLDRYFAGQRPDIGELPLNPQGSEFRRAVWEILCEIPYGQCITYGDIAKKMARRLNRKTMSGQAVGGAVGHNPVSIVIPCHRVVGANGSLTGYAGGIDLKIRLLELEGVDLSRFFVPKKGTAL